MFFQKFEESQEETKFCQHCGASIDKACVVCPKCGKQAEQLQGAQPNIVINNSNTNRIVNRIRGCGCAKNKWVALFLCITLGFFGAHKFYEGKTGMGLLYRFTLGLFGIGWITDIILIFLKPVTYYV